MKFKSILIITFFIFNFKAFSQCQFKGVNVWPNNQTISPNSVFILDINTEQNPQFENKVNSLYLKSATELIKLKIIKELKCEFNIKQYFVKPESPLKPNTEYNLISDITSKNSSCQKSRFSWKTISEQSTKEYTWSESPKELNKTLQSLGCGDIKTIQYSVKIKNENDFVVLVETQQNNKKIEFFTFINNGKISFGKGYHCGEIDFKTEQDYSVNLKLMNSTGHIVGESKHTIAFNESNVYTSSSLIFNKDNKPYLLTILLFNVLSILGYWAINKYNKLQLQ